MSGIRIGTPRFINLENSSKSDEIWNSWSKSFDKERELTEMSIGQIVNSVNYLEKELDLIINNKGANILGIIEDIQRFPMNITSKVWIISKMIKQSTLEYPALNEIVEAHKLLSKSIFNSCDLTTEEHKTKGVPKKLFIQLIEELIRYRNSVAHNPFIIEVNFKNKKCTGILVVNKSNGKGKIEKKCYKVWSQVECLHHIISRIMKLLINQSNTKEASA